MIFNSIFDLEKMKGKTIKSVYVVFTSDDKEVVCFSPTSSCGILNDGVTYTINFKNGIIVDDKFVELIKKSNACYRDGIEQYFEFGEIKYLRTKGFYDTDEEITEKNNNIIKGFTLAKQIYE